MFSLFSHQKVALNYLRLNDSFILRMEQGTGKTLPSLCRIDELLKSHKIANALVVCPKSVIGSWERDIEKFTSESQKRLKAGLTIINYDSVWRGKYDKVWDLILCDEAHSIANRTSKRSKWLLKASLKAKYRYLLTGTPISNGRLEDSWSLITFLYPVKGSRTVNGAIWQRLTGKQGSYYDWLDRYAYLDQYYKPYKYKNISEVQDALFENSYSIQKIDCLDLPDKLPDEIRLLELKEKKLYKEMAKNNTITERDILADNPLTKLLYLRLICSGALDDTATAKAEALEDLLLEMGENKLVIFFEFKASKRAIEDVLNKQKIKYVVLDGESKNHNIWRDFQTDESIQIILCQYVAGSAGIDLFSSSTILYYEPTLRSNILEQSRDRIHRTGQKNKCSYIHFLTKGTIEEHIYKALAGYKDFSSKLFSEYMEDYQRAFRR